MFIYLKALKFSLLLVPVLNSFSSIQEVAGSILGPATYLS